MTRFLDAFYSLAWDELRDGDKICEAFHHLAAANQFDDVDEASGAIEALIAAIKKGARSGGASIYAHAVAVRAVIAKQVRKSQADWKARHAALDRDVLHEIKEHGTGTVSAIAQRMGRPHFVDDMAASIDRLANGGFVQIVRTPAEIVGPLDIVRLAAAQ